MATAIGRITEIILWVLLVVIGLLVIGTVVMGYRLRPR